MKQVPGLSRHLERWRGSPSRLLGLNSSNERPPVVRVEHQHWARSSVLGVADAYRIVTERAHFDTVTVEGAARTLPPHHRTLVSPTHPAWLSSNAAAFRRSRNFTGPASLLPRTVHSDLVT